jgi:hypothetical protein
VKKRGIILIVLGLLGVIFVTTFDIIVRKPVNDFTGPISTPALIVCGLVILTGIAFLFRKPKE